MTEAQQALLQQAREKGRDAREVIDAAELALIQQTFAIDVRDSLKGIAPFTPAKVRATEIHHAPYRVAWTAFSEDECEFCGGSGSVTVKGRNLQTADIDCPTCGGTGDSEEDGESWNFYTDIDGHYIGAPGY